MSTTISPAIFAHTRRKTSDVKPPSAESRNITAVRDLLARINLADASALEGASVTEVETSLYVVQRGLSKYAVLDAKPIDRVIVTGIVSIKDGEVQATILTGDGVSQSTHTGYAARSALVQPEIQHAAARLAAGYLSEI